MEEALRPEHYKAGNMDVIAFCHHHDLSFCRGNIIKYVTRAGKKKSSNPLKELEDLQKAMVYLEREIARLTPKENLNVEGLMNPKEFFGKYSFLDEKELKMRHAMLTSRREQLGLSLLTADEFKTKVLAKLQYPNALRDFELFLKHKPDGTFDEFATQSFT